MYIVINPGHVYYEEGDSRNTPGKRSPDSSLIEAVWNLEVANLLYNKLLSAGYSCCVAKASSESESVTYPVKVCKEACTKYGIDNVIFLSIHVNAQANGTWGSAQGWSVWTCVGETKSDRLATCLYNSALSIFSDRKVRSDNSDGDPDYESNFYVLRKTPCVAVLVENFFMDNKDDCEFLKTDDCKTRCVDVMFEGLINFIYGCN